MNRSRPWQFARAIAAVLCIGVTICLALLPVPFSVSTGSDVIEIDRVTSIGRQGETETISLPARWITPYNRQEARRFRVVIPGATASDGARYLYVPFLEQRLRVYSDDILLFDSENIRHWSGPVSYLSAFAALPGSDSGEDKAIDLRIDAGPLPGGALSRIFVGPRDQLLPSYRLRGFLEERVKPMFFGAQAILAFISLGLFYLRPSDRIFGWQGATLIMVCVTGIGLHMAYLPVLETILRQIYLLAPLIGLCLLGFTLSLLKRPVPKWLIAGLIAMTALSYLGSAIPGVTLRSVGFYVSIPTFLLLICWSTILLFLNVERNSDPAVPLFLVGQFIIIYGVGHDLLARIGYLEDGILIARLANGVTTIGIAIFLIGRQAETANSLDASAANLRGQLAAREAELAMFYEQQGQADRQEAIDAERQRITSDLHDGVAGHLATIVALAESDDNSTDEIGASAKNALTDLRLVLDALGLPDGSIGYALGSFRERFMQPLERLGIAVRWDVEGIPERTTLSREAMLNILRILQEAVNNAVRHGNPDQIHISAHLAEDGGLIFSVENTGGVPYSPAEACSGLGMDSMRRRAAALDAALDIEPLDSGARLTLRIGPKGLTQPAPDTN